LASLLAHEDEGVRAAAEIGQDYAQQQRRKAMEEERYEDGSGR